MGKTLAYEAKIERIRKISKDQILGITNDSRVVQAWLDWTNMRIEKFLTPTTFTNEAQIRILAPFTDEERLKIITQTIEHGWGSLRYVAKEKLDVQSSISSQAVSTEIKETEVTTDEREWY